MSFLSLLFLPKCIGDLLYHCPCPLAGNWASHESGLADSWDVCTMQHKPEFCNVEAGSSLFHGSNEENGLTWGEIDDAFFNNPFFFQENFLWRCLKWKLRQKDKTYSFRFFKDFLFFSILLFFFISSFFFNSIFLFFHLDLPPNVSSAASYF